MMGKLRASFLTENGFHLSDVLIETGTHSGLSLARVAHLFREIHTIELDPALHARSLVRLASHPHVRCHLGPSPEVLRRIIEPSKAVTFWLDAHAMPDKPPRFLRMSEGAVRRRRRSERMARRAARLGTAVIEPARPALDAPECPVLEELRVILSIHWTISPIILIDDAHLYQEWTWKERPELVVGLDKDQWPAQAEIEGLVKSHGRQLRQLSGVLVIDA